MELARVGCAVAELAADGRAVIVELARLALPTLRCGSAKVDIVLVGGLALDPKRTTIHRG